MAGPIVHEKFFGDCVQDTDLQDLYHMNKTNCNIFSQGHDLLLYIQPINFIRNRQVSLMLSNYNFKEFVYNYLKVATNNGSAYVDGNVMLFLYGYISHHILDSFFHPFIMQYCEDYLPVKGRDWSHGKIETLYDTYFIKKYFSPEPVKFKLHKQFKYEVPKCPEFINNIESSSREVYDIKGLGGKFNIAFKNIEKFMSLYRYDPHDFKKRLGYISDSIIDLGARDFFYDERKLDELEQYMNNGHNLWSNIWLRGCKDNDCCDDSFDDIYSKALAITKQTILDISSLSSSEVNMNNIAEIVPDRSAITGLSCGKDLPFIKKRGNR